MSNVKPTEIDNLARLLSIMEQLRDPVNGCPWDQQQTMQSLTRYTLEEAYEVVDAIERSGPQDIRDELGDLLFQVVFYAQLGKEQGEFDFNDIANAISNKMVRRHPHVFGDNNLPVESVEQQWDAIKAAEKQATGQATGILDDVPVGMPALMYAQKLQKRCAKVGFDWDSPQPVLAKVKEEVEEIAQELNACAVNAEKVEEEIGDALFAMVNLARHCHVDADTALRKASHKFARRFNQVESLAQANQQSLAAMSLAELEALWQEVKAQRAAANV